MIKIQISNIEEFKSDYLLKVKNDVIKRIKYLKYSVSHLIDPDNISNNEIAKAKHSTKHIIDLIRDSKISIDDLVVAKYKNTLLTYTTGFVITHVDLNPLLNFLNYLLDDANGSLNNLLICAPENLFTKNTTLLNDHRINSEIYINILKNAFLYDSEIGINIRQFFHEKNITNYCPYCNMASALYSTNDETGKIADQHQLDHFFDKATHPLLSLSVFNLVPTDYNCNSANKGAIHFSDELHLNPYITGFKNDMKFVPIMDAFGEVVQSISLKLHADRNSYVWKQLIGDEDFQDLAPEHGNINVFQLYKRYNNSGILFTARKLVKKFRNVAANEQSLRRILDEIEDSPQDNYQNFRDWYEDEIMTKFHQKDFGEVIFSKLNRDVLDFVFDNYPENFHESVNNILTNSYMPENGAE